MKKELNRLIHQLESLDGPSQCGCSGPSSCLEEDCWGYVPTPVCLECKCCITYLLTSSGMSGHKMVHVDQYEIHMLSSH